MNRRLPSNLTLLMSEKELNNRIHEMAQEIAANLQNNHLLAIGLLKGSFVFMADLVRAMHRHHLVLNIDFLNVSSYGSGTSSSGTVTLNHPLSLDIKNRDVLLIDDILDTGTTLNWVSHYIQKQQPASLKTCVMLNKTIRRKEAIEANYVGLTIEDGFVVGYGLDYDHRYRELPYLAILNP